MEESPSFPEPGHPGSVEQAIAGAAPPPEYEGDRIRESVLHRFFGEDAPRFGRYEDVKPVGKGGQGVVYRAHDPELERPVALKVLEGGEDDDAVTRLLEEARALARVRHPNVVTVHEVGRAHGRGFIAMDYCEGGSLRAWVARPGRPAKHVVRVFADAASALAAAHEAGMVHGDIKPDNLLLDGDDRVRVGDFGLARAPASGTGAPLDGTTISEAAGDTDAAGATAGTPAYMAPEQRELGALTPATDQYSFFVALHEVLTGVRPDRNAPPAVRGRIARVISRGLSVDPDRRFSDMAEARRALLVAIRGRGSMALAGLTALLAAGLGAAILTTPTHPVCEVASRLGDATPEGPPVLTRYAQKLRSEYDLLCATTGELPSATVAARARCLEDARVRMDTVRAASGGRVVAAAAGLPDPRGCQESGPFEGARADDALLNHISGLLARAELAPGPGTIAEAEQLEADPRLADDPLLRGRVSLALGLTRGGSGRPLPAMADLERAWGEAMQARDFSTAARAASELGLLLLRVRGDVPDARRWIESGESLLPAELDPGQQFVFAAARAELELFDLAPDRAEPHVARARKLIEESFGPDDARLVEVLWLEAELLRVRLKSDEAYRRFGAALEHAERIGEGASTLVIRPLLGRISYEIQGRDAAAAFAGLDRVESVLTEHGELESDRGVHLLRLRAVHAANSKDPALAARLFERAEGLGRRVLGPTSYEMAAIYQGRAGLAQAAGDWAEAARTLRAAAESYLAAFGAADYGYMTSVASWAHAESRLGRAGEAWRGLQGAEAKLDAADPEKTYVRAYLLAGGGRLLEALGRPAEGAAHQLRVFEASVEGGAPDTQLVPLLADAARLQMVAGEWEEASKTVERMLSHLERVQDPSPDLALQVHLVALLHAREVRPADVKHHLARVEEISRAASEAGTELGDRTRWRLDRVGQLTPGAFYPPDD